MRIAGVAFEAKRADVVLVDVVSGEPQWVQLSADIEEDAFEAARRIGKRLPGHRISWIDVGLAYVELPHEPSYAELRMQGAIIAGVPDLVPVVQMPELRWRETFFPDDDLDGSLLERCVELGFRPIHAIGADGGSEIAYRAFALAWVGRQLCARTALKEGALR